MRQLIVLLAAVLPVLGTVGSIAANEVSLRNATTWRIPITGYDPRDPLRGRYIAFRYVWTAIGDPASCKGDQCSLCLRDGGAKVLIRPKGATCPARIDLASSGLSITSGTAAQGGQVSAAARLWVSEARAPVLEGQLRTRPMVAVARLTSGGRLIADRLEPAN